MSAPFGSPGPQGRRVRWLALLALVPAVPALLCSTAALALFYLAPGRFSALLARLPGEDLLRTALFFAPATLFAVVTLAVLYALEPAGEPAAPPRAAPLAPSLARRLGLLALGAGLPLLLLSATALALAFLVPGRFYPWLARLPAGDLLRRALPLAPFAALALTALGGAALSLARAPGTAPGLRLTPERLLRLAVALVLAAALSWLAAALGALALFRLAPGTFERLATRLPAETLLRLGLLFAPTALLAVVLLAALYLAAGWAGQAHQGSPAERWAGRAAVALAVAGLTLVAVAALALLAATLVLLLR